MTVEVKKKQGESSEALIRRFTKRVLESGIINQAKKTRFRSKPLSERAKKISALRRLKDRQRREYLIKIGVLKQTE